ncbi:mitochondrial sodium/calcium exchanger protein-like [Saccoglossus kowalevskii]
MCHSVPVSDQFLVWHVALIIGAILSVLVFLTSSHDKPPVYHWVFAYAGFGMGVVWIYATANEIINALQALGIMFDLSEELLGFLLLAIGNSIADLVTDTTNAKAGRPVMSIGACFGGPLFNMLLGFGIAGTIGAIRADGEDLMISYQPLQAAYFSRWPSVCCLLCSSCLFTGLKSPNHMEYIYLFCTSFFSLLLYW